MAQDLSKIVPRPVDKPAPVDPNAGTWRDPRQYDPTFLSQVGGEAIVDVYEGLAQLPGSMYNVLRGFMERQRQKSPEELRGTADPYDTAAYDTAVSALEGAVREPRKTAANALQSLKEYGEKTISSPAGVTQFIAETLTPLPKVPGAPKAGPVSQVVKPKGGDFPQQLEAIERLKTWEPATDLPVPEKAINNWLETKLGKYIRTEMATPEDPIRKLAEEGILHVDPEQINYQLGAYGRSNRFGKEPVQLLAKSDTAKIWEGATDNQMGIDRAGFIIDFAKRDGLTHYTRFVRDNPWITDVAAKDPNRPIYVPSEDLGLDLGFDHLRDELFNSIDPESGLPRQLQLTNEQLGRMSVPDAVRHVSKINKWREKQKAEANFALANNAATVPFKDYPDQKYGWFQLTTDSPKNRQVLQDALNYEADLMGHCVRGYCEDVLAGRSQIYSLRDKKTGAPHVTIEVEPYGSFAESKRQIDAMYPDLDENEKMRMLNEQGWLDENGDPLPTPLGRILQIKGKGNLKPKADYIPFVQDFVKSQQWDMVQDLSNANLVDLNSSQISDNWVRTKMADHVARQVLEDMQNEGARFVTLDELNARHSAMVKERVAVRKAAEPPEQKAARQQLRELRRAERRQERGE
jgi:acyl carrier protein phosphodiesterase